MRSISRIGRSSQGGRSASAGFSLLEMVVAISVLALALAAMYQAASGATRNVRTDEKYTYSVELARSLLAMNTRVPLSGVNENGETSGGFVWRVESRPLDFGRSSLRKGSLQEIAITVSWADGRKQRELVLNSVVEGVER